MVEVVYVCSPDYWRHLFLSLRSLYASESSFDRVTVFVTGQGCPNWNFSDSRVHIENVPDIGNGYWYLNKTHLCKSNADTVIFLDTDTVVLSPIDNIYEKTSKDLVARRAPSVNTKYFRKPKWKRKLNHFGVGKYPYLSCGFMIYQNKSHMKIKSRWESVTKRILEGESEGQTTRFAEQEAMSISASAECLSLELMEPHHHAYAMIGEDYRGSIVYHLGTPNFYHYYLKVEEDMDLKKIDTPIPRPKFLRVFKFINRVRKKIKNMRGGNRDADVVWKGE